MEEFEKLLKAHDWTYMYSDDSRWWRKGEAEMKVINAAIKRLGQPAQDLYDVYYKKAFPS